MKKFFFALILVLFLFDYCSASYVVPAAVPAQTRIKQGGELFLLFIFIIHQMKIKKLNSKKIWNVFLQLIQNL